MRPLRRLTEEQARMATELDVASNIQLSMLPDSEENGAQASEYAIHARLIPAKEVGGDFYDFFVIDEDHVAIVIADVVGKGVPASLFSMVAKTMLKMSALEGHSPGKVCTEVNNRLCENNKEAMFVTVWFGIYSIRERTIRYVNAGHDSAVIFSEGNWQFDTADSDMAFGIMDDLPYTEHTRTLKEGERMLLYTDGVVEAQAADSGAELYGEDRLLSRLNGDLEMAGDNLITAIYDDTNVFIGASPQFDDITMVLLEVRG
jgi:sigma-B regulation protein RsbU (phosphoserine phosphatase)